MLEDQRLTVQLAGDRMSVAAAGMLHQSTMHPITMHPQTSAVSVSIRHACICGTLYNLHLKVLYCKQLVHVI